MLLSFLDVLDGDETAQPAGVVHHQEFLDAILVQQLLGMLQAQPLVRGDELGSHEIPHRLIQVPLKAHIAIGQDAHQTTILGHHWQA